MDITLKFLNDLGRALVHGGGTNKGRYFVVETESVNLVVSSDGSVNGTDSIEGLHNRLGYTSKDAQVKAACKGVIQNHDSFKLAWGTKDVTGRQLQSVSNAIIKSDSYEETIDWTQVILVPYYDVFSTFFNAGNSSLLMVVSTIMISHIVLSHLSESLGTLGRGQEEEAEVAAAIEKEEAEDAAECRFIELIDKHVAGMQAGEALSLYPVPPDVLLVPRDSAGAAHNVKDSDVIRASLWFECVQALHRARKGKSR